jgi:hypothetical protein
LSVRFPLFVSDRSALQERSMNIFDDFVSVFHHWPTLVTFARPEKLRNDHETFRNELDALKRLQNRAHASKTKESL